MTSIKTMLVPLDGSAQATAAMPVARGLAELLLATVAVLHLPTTLWQAPRSSSA
jgi:hypothetical protein